MEEKEPIHADLVIEGGWVLTMVGDTPPLEQARVVVKEGRIVQVDDSQHDMRVEALEVIDATGGLVMPGLVNGHCHTAMTLFRGLADDLPLKPWLYEKIFPAEGRYLNPENVYWGTLLGCVEMMASGTTTFSDGYFFQDDAIQAVHRAGLRAVMAQGIIDFPAPGVPEPSKNLEVGRAFLEKWQGFSELISPGLFCHSPVTCSRETLRGAMSLCKQYSVPLQIHLAETREEVHEIINKTGLRPAQYIEEIGLLAHDLVAAHAIHLEEEEITLLSKGGVKIVHVPESNMKLASGIAKVMKMIEEGIPLGLGTDGCASNNNLDLFEEMDKAAKLQKVSTGNPVSLKATTALKMVTAWGADVLGLGEEIGTIEKGKKADIIVIDLEKPHLTPCYHPASTVVYAANGGDVRDVVVNGKILVKEGRILHVDLEEIMDRVNAISRTIRV